MYHAGSMLVTVFIRGILANQAYAEVLAANCGTFEHSEAEDRNYYGENLYMCWGSTDCYTPENAMYLLCKSCYRWSLKILYGKRSWGDKS